MTRPDYSVPLHGTVHRNSFDMLQPTAKSSDFPVRFQQEALNLINELLFVSGSAFYLLNAEMRRRGVAVFHVEESMVEEYHEHFLDIDPLNPKKFHKTADRVAFIDDQISFAELQQTEYYKRFMVPHNHRYAADMFFRRDQEIIAVLGILRRESDGPFRDEELELLRKLQPFLEYTLNAVYLPKRALERTSLQQKYHLTERELDVLELIIDGANNKLIADTLHVSPATVKTHLIHIFRKTDAVSRTDLLAKIIADLTLY